MLGRIAGGVAALGLIGGVGHVAWHNGSATVKVTDDSGVVHSTSIEGDGTQYSCPAGTHNEVDPIIEEAGRIKITLDSVDPDAQPDRYDSLVDAYNADVDKYNSILQSECSS
jgi:hypothetical protein